VLAESRSRNASGAYWLVCCHAPTLSLPIDGEN